MANAICPECLRLVSWRATRGSSLADLRCPDCSGVLERARYHCQPPMTEAEATAVRAGKASCVFGSYYGTNDGRPGHWGAGRE